MPEWKPNDEEMKKTAIQLKRYFERRSSGGSARKLASERVSEWIRLMGEERPSVDEANRLLLAVAETRTEGSAWEELYLWIENWTQQLGPQEP